MYASSACYDERLVERVLMTHPPDTLVIHKTGMPTKPREYIVCPGFAPSNTLGVYLHNVDAVVSALTERFLYIKVDGRHILPPQPIRGCFRRQGYTEFRRKVLSHIPTHFPVLSRTQCVAAFNGPKRAKYENARVSLLRCGLKRRDAILSAFCKFSKIEVGDPARIISPRDPRWNLELARYIKHLEGHIYRSIHKTFAELKHADRTSHYTVMKGLDVDQTAHELRLKWDMFSDPVAVTCDVSKLDACLGLIATVYEHSFYTGVFPRDRQLRWILQVMRRHHIVARLPDGTVIVHCPGRKASGDVTTAVGDIIVVTSVWYNVFTLLNFVMELADMGDDALVFMERTDLDEFLRRVVGVFMEAGFILKIENIAHEFEEIVFCQQHPMLIGGKWRMVREPTTVVSKDTMCLLHCPNEKLYRKWLGAVAAAGMHLCDGVPVLSTFYECLRRSGRPPSDRMFNHLMQHTHYIRRDKRCNSTIDDAARVSFYYATGVTPDAQLAIESQLSSMLIDGLRVDVELQEINEMGRGTQLNLLYCNND